MAKNPMIAQANAMREAKLRRMGLQVRTADEFNERGEGHTGPANDGTQGVDQGQYADDYQDGEPQKVKSLIRPTQFRRPGGSE